MLVGLYTDAHFSQSSSIILGKKDSFSGRLQNLIESFKWMNEVFTERGVKEIFCLGDLTDKPNLTSEEISALGKCNLDGHRFILGNHCRSDKDGYFNSLSVFEKVYNKPEYLNLDDCIFYLLPYNSTLTDLNSLDPKPDVILSHNDIMDFNYGNYLSKTGYELSDIVSNCKLFINGHLHNGEWLIKNRVMNLGSITGVNFASCGGEWDPSIGILDTDTLKVELIENPIAYKFRKLSFNNYSEVKNYLSSLSKQNYVLQIKVPQRIVNDVRDLLNDTAAVAASRVLSLPEQMSVANQIMFEELNDKQESLNEYSKSPYEKLKEYVKDKAPAKYSINTILDIIDKIEKEV